MAVVAGDGVGGTTVDVGVSVSMTVVMVATEGDAESAAEAVSVTVVFAAAAVAVAVARAEGVGRCGGKGGNTPRRTASPTPLTPRSRLHGPRLVWGRTGGAVSYFGPRAALSRHVVGHISLKVLRQISVWRTILSV